MAASSSPATASFGTDGVQSTCPGSSRTSSSTTCARLPSPTIRSVSAGQPRRREAPRVGEPVDVLVALEHADEERATAAPATGVDRTEERVEIHERRERRRRLDARRSHEPGRVARDRPHGVDAPNRLERDAIGQRRQELPRAGAVEPRRGPPVAVHLEDHRLAAPRREHGGRLVRALHEHRVGLERLDLAPGAERQLGPEPRPVELLAPRHEPERLVARRRAVARAREHAHVELGRERVELALQVRLERQPVARPPDDQDSRLHAAARTRISSSCP